MGTGKSTTAEGSRSPSAGAATRSRGGMRTGAGGVRSIIYGCQLTEISIQSSVPLAVSPGPQEGLAAVSPRTRCLHMGTFLRPGSYGRAPPTRRGLGQRRLTADDERPSAGNVLGDPVLPRATCFSSRRVVRQAAMGSHPAGQGCLGPRPQRRPFHRLGWSRWP